MLAEPRRKQKVVNLRGGNSAWSDDGDKFGQRMLERMGWSRGKGLGAREDGVVTHVVARYKNDERGLGYEERSDQWTQHEDQFSKLLADLSGGGNGEKNISNSDGQIIPHSGVSLEVKSKKSRARVHYHKFTRGKDLSRYSEKDLANIFGKKSLRVADEDATPGENAVDSCEVQKTTQLFKMGGTIDDYFNGKLQALGRSTVSAPISRDRSPEHVFRGFAGGPSHSDTEAADADVPVAAFSFYKPENVRGPEDLTSDINNENSDRKKKKNKHEREESATVDNTKIDMCEMKTGSGGKKEKDNEPVQLSVNNCENLGKIKKKKSKKKLTLAERDESEEEKRRYNYELSQSVEFGVAKIKKKKSKKKPAVDVEQEKTRDEGEDNVTANISNKSKRKAAEDNTGASENSHDRKKRKTDKKTPT